MNNPNQGGQNQGGQQGGQGGQQNKQGGGGQQKPGRQNQQPGQGGQQGGGEQHKPGQQNQEPGQGGHQGEAASKLADVAQQAGGQAKQAAASLASEANQKSKGLFNQKVTVGADLAGHIAESVKCAAENLDHSAPNLAGLVRGAADRVEGFSRDMRGQTVEDLVRTASDFTRRQPAMVFGLASLAGFFLFRVLKSSPSAAPEAGSQRSSSERAGQFHGA
jgi:hypothetical protein